MIIKLHEFDESIFDGIIKTQAYFDSVKFRLSHKVLLDRFMTSFLMDELQDYNAPGSVALVTKPLKYPKGDWCDMVLDIKQPNADTLMCLVDRVQYSGPILMNYAEVALDQIFASKAEAERFAVFLVQSLIQSRNSQPVKTKRQHTAYFKRKVINGRLSDHNIAIYSHEGARMHHGDPCCHLEVRYTTAESLGELGLYGPQDLLFFNFEAYFAKELTLYNINNAAAIERLVARFLGKSKAKKPWRMRQYHLPGGKTIDIDLQKRYQRAIVNEASVWLYGEEVVSAHNLKLIGDLWYGRKKEPAITAEEYLARREELMHQEQADKRKVYFETRWFDTIDNRRLLNLENMLSD